MNKRPDKIRRIYTIARLYTHWGLGVCFGSLAPTMIQGMFSGLALIAFGCIVGLIIDYIYGKPVYK